MLYQYAISDGPGTLIEHGEVGLGELQYKIMRAVAYGWSLIFAEVKP